MGRLLVIARHTFWEAVAQPIFGMLIVLAAVVLMIYGVLPFFTFSEDTRMFKSVGLDVVLVVVLVGTLFATSRSIHDEIEDRTMLTLMSKPVSRAQVLLGKYFGIIASAGVAVAVLGVVLAICVYFRVPGDHGINSQSVDEAQLARLRDFRVMHVTGLAGALLLTWLQIAVLAAISVAISTRVSLVVNLPVVLVVYFAGNMSRFLDAAAQGASWLTRIAVEVVNTVLPFLATFDLRDKTVYKTIAITPTFRGEVGAVSPWEITADLAAATAYAGLYITAALAAGLLLLRTRELSGAAE